MPSSSATSSPKSHWPGSSRIGVRPLTVVTCGSLTARIQPYTASRIRSPSFISGLFITARCIFTHPVAIPNLPLSLKF